MQQFYKVLLKSGKLWQEDFLSVSYRYIGEIMPLLLMANFCLTNHDGWDNFGTG